MGENLGAQIERVLDVGGGVALTGMLIVFVALTALSGFITLLPKIVAVLDKVAPPKPEHQSLVQSPSSGEAEPEVLAAIGFALHQELTGRGART